MSFVESNRRHNKQTIMKIRCSPLVLVCIGFAMLVTGCVDSAPWEKAQSVTPLPSRAPEVGAAAASSLTKVEESHSSALETLWKQRTGDATADASGSGFTLGPGDVLKISVPQIPQLKDRTERVSEKDTIALPLLGLIDVRGMTQQDLLNDLTRRVRRYMYHPQVAVFLVHSESRDVAVLGAVKNPGRYMIASRSDSVMTMISRSGGTSVDAASRIILIPAPATPQRALSSGGSSSFATLGLEGSDTRLASVSPVALHELPDPAALTGRQRLGQVVITPSSTQDQRYLELPVKPGDVIIIPTAGQVTVQGWVDKPGAFPIQPGLTVLGSIAAAGGAMFTSQATLLREEGAGRKVEIPMNLAKMRHGEEPDILVQSGDLVVVERSAAGALPYSLYFLVRRINIGAFSAIP
jgi:polysaccharide export outer membrane protein